jgi:transcription factor C subunit 6
MDGYTYLTDLRAPGSEKTNSHRSRLATAHIQYLAPIKCMIQSEESEFIKILPLRRFFSNNNAAKASASVTSLATSPLHPCTLAGAADGTVIGTNPTRRALSHKSGQYQQCWFAHDYSSTGGEAGDGHSMSRILDGFKAEKSNMHRVNSHTGAGDAIWATTWEEGGHITALAWNGNAKCGGWAAASMGSGLMRVEDVSI